MSKILLVEDEPLNQRVARAMLERLGHKVVTVETGRDAVVRLRERDIDLVLLDLGLPDMRGTAVARHMRKEEAREGFRAVPIYALTAEDVEGDLEGFSGALGKPLRQEDVERVFAAHEGSAIDLEAFRGRVSHDDELFRELLGELLVQIDPMLGAVASAASPLDRETLRSATHRMKGALLAVSAQRAADVAQRLESNARIADASAIDLDIASLRAELEKVRAVAREAVT